MIITLEVYHIRFVRNNLVIYEIIDADMDVTAIGNLKCGMFNCFDYG